MNDDSRDTQRPWFPPPPGRLLGRGHPAGDFLEAHEWQMLEQAPGRLRLQAHLPQHVRNPRGHLFGGFTPTYVDLVALRTAHGLLPAGTRGGMTTVNMRVDYFEPVMEDQFILEGRVVNSRGKIHLVEVLFRDLQGKLLVFSITTLRQRGPSNP